MENPRNVHGLLHDDDADQPLARSLGRPPDSSSPTATLPYYFVLSYLPYLLPYSLAHTYEQHSMDLGLPLHVRSKRSGYTADFAGCYRSKGRALPPGAAKPVTCRSLL